MKIKVYDFKKRTSVITELKRNFLKVATDVLGSNISQIKKVNIRVLKHFPTASGYDKAFLRLYKGGVVNLIITPGYDINEENRLNVIAHEMVHIKQFMTGELVFIKNKKEKKYIYRGKVYRKVYSLEKFDNLLGQRKKQIEYISKICPWEREPSLVADKYAPRAFN